MVDYLLISGMDVAYDIIRIVSSIKNIDVDLHKFEVFKNYYYDTPAGDLLANHTTIRKTYSTNKVDNVYPYMVYVNDVAINKDAFKDPNSTDILSDDDKTKIKTMIDIDCDNIVKTLEYFNKMFGITLNVENAGAINIFFNEVYYAVSADNMICSYQVTLQTEDSDVLTKSLSSIEELLMKHINIDGEKMVKNNMSKYEFGRAIIAEYNKKVSGGDNNDGQNA